MNILLIAEIIVSVLLVAAVLIQQKGVGLGSVFGGEGNVFGTKRGIEKGIFILTIILAVVFLVLTSVSIAIK